jgi:hypothetical protein
MARQGDVGVVEQAGDASSRIVVADHTMPACFNGSAFLKEMMCHSP